MPRGRPRKDASETQATQNIEPKSQSASGRGDGGQGEDPAIQQLKENEERVYRNAQYVDHDLYKLQIESCLKNPHPNQDQVAKEMLVEKEHVHFFHTVDGSGRAKTYKHEDGKTYYITEQQCNHFHLVELEKSEDGKPPRAKCVSGPVKWGKRKVATKDGGAKYVKTVVPAGPSAKGYDPSTGQNNLIQFDKHQHEVVYVHSNRIPLRKANAEAAKHEAHHNAQFNQSMPGVISR